MSRSLDLIQTGRLVGEAATLGHLDDLKRLHRDPEVMRTLSADGQVMPDEETHARLQRQVEHWERHGFGLWMFRLRAEGGFVGRGGLQWFEIEGERCVGLAYAVVSEHWRRGFATEMAEASLAVGFERLGFPTIATWTLPHNRASRRVMEKLGFREVREITFAGLPHVCQELAASEWRRLRQW